MTRFKNDITRDILYALRTLRRAPAFALVAILTLALGIGLTTAIFSIVDKVLLHPLPYPHPDRLVVVWEKLARDPGSPPVFDSYRDFEIWRRHSRSFEQIAAATWATGPHIFRGAGAARNVLAMPVGLHFFALLGIAPELGRTFEPDDLSRGCTVVLSHRFRVQAFGHAADVTGRRVWLNEQDCTIVGVMPPGFHFYPDAASMWMLITPGSAIARDPEHANVGVFGRLRRGVSIAAAQQELEALRRREGQTDPPGSERTAAVYPLAEQFAYVTGPTLRRSVALLFGAVSFVLLIACVNLANLLLGRSLVRQKELAVRAGLGSGRARLVRQLLTEALLLSVAGAIAGALLAETAIHYFRVWKPIPLPPGDPVSVNLTVLAFTAALAVLTAAASGLIPALRASRVDPIEALKSGGRAASLGPRTALLSRALAATQITLSISLLAGAALLIDSVNRMASVPLGFRTDNVLKMSVDLPSWSYPTPGKRDRFYREALSRAGAIPGVRSAAFATSLPLVGGRFRTSTLAIEGRPQPSAEVGEASITPAYFRTMGVRFEAGRPFDDRDTDRSEPVAVVNDALVHRSFPRENPIGKHIRVGDSTKWLTIVGIAGTEKDRYFFREMTWDDTPLVFRPLPQQPPEAATLVLRASGGPDVGTAVQKQLRGIDSNVPVGDLETMDAELARVLAYPRFRAVILGTFAGLALLLAGLGLYGVLAQATAQRTQEFGLRMALGAEGRDVLRLVIRQGMFLTGAGLLAGLLVGFALTRLLADLLYGIRSGDPWIWAGVSVLLLAVALLATSIPALRAARVDPLVSLRYE